MLTYINQWRTKRKCKKDLKERFPQFYALWSDQLKIEVLREYREKRVFYEDRMYMRMLKQDYGTKSIYFIEETSILFSVQPRFNFHYTAYRVLNKEGDIHMAALPNYIAKFITEPPKEVMERQESSLHLFLDVMKQFKEENGEVRVANNITYLLNSNLCSHPKVHRGYYDTKHKGVLFVKDCSTGESIRKDESVLLPTGEFIKHNSPKVIKNLSTTQHKQLLLALNGNTDVLKVFEGSFIYEQEYQIYLPFSLTIFKKTIHPKRLCEAFFHSYMDWVAAAGVIANPEEITDLPQPLIKAALKQRVEVSPTVANHTQVSMYFPESERDRFNGYLLPKDSTFFADWLILDHDAFGQNMSDVLRNDNSLPGIYLNTPTGIKWKVNNNIGTAMLLPTEISGTFPFQFLVVCQRAQKVTVNKKTENSEGRLLSHNANILEFKVGFLMTPEEKVLYDRYNLEHKAALKEFQANRKEGDQPPTKHPSQEPIFLGLELEVVAKGAMRCDQGVKQVIKQMADSSFGNHIIAKHDGSIGTHGLEIVSVPATLAYHKDMFEKHFFGEPNMLHKNLMATDTCGIHVHISKNAFTALDIGKYMAFINSNANKAFVDAMSNRPPNAYCVKQPLAGKNALGVDISAKIGLTACREGKVKKGLNFTTLPRENATRRRAINLQNAHTLEVRSFKASTDKNNVLRKLEFCESLLKFVRASSPQQMTAYDYVNFLLDKANKSSYPYLIRWLASKGYIDHDRRMVKYLDKEEKKTRNKLVHVYNNNKIPNPHKKEAV